MVIPGEAFSSIVTPALVSDLIEAILKVLEVRIFLVIIAQKEAATALFVIEIVAVFAEVVQ